MEQKNFQDLYREAQDASESGRSYLAAPFLTLKWDKMAALAPASVAKGNLDKLKEKLLFTAFCDLPLPQAGEVLEKHFLDFLASDMGISDALKTRFIFLGNGNENADREALRQAVLKNQQSLGGKKVSEWLQTFDKAYPPEGGDEAAAGKFFAGYPDVANLSKTEQALLKLLLQVYDEWLRAPLVTIFDAAEIYKKLDELEKSGVKEVNMNTFARDYFSSSGAPRISTTSTMGGRSSALSVNTVSLPLLQALPKYENLGNQLITRERIKVKSQAEPVRPSLLYWLKYYRDELGIGQHSSVERGDFLFRSENGRKLSGEERERISLILKSVEENLPLSIDPKNQEIVFPVFQAVVMTPRKEPASSTVQRGEPGSLSFSESGGLHISRGTSFNMLSRKESVPSAGKESARPSAPRNAGEISFSTSHVFPAEKEAVESRDAVSAKLERGEPSFLSFPTPSSPKAVNAPAFSAPKAEENEAGKPAPAPAPYVAKEPARNPAEQESGSGESSQSRFARQKLNTFRIRPVSLGRKVWEKEAKRNEEI